MVKVSSIGATVVGFRKTEYPSNKTLAVLAQLRYEDGEVEEFAVSVNLDHPDNGYASRSLQKDEFFCKNWLEGTEIYNALVASEWLVPTGKVGSSGFVHPPVCKIGSKAKVA